MAKKRSSSRTPARKGNKAAPIKKSRPKKELAGRKRESKSRSDVDRSKEKLDIPSLNIGLWRHNRKTDTLTWSPNAANLLGLPGDHILPETFDELYLLIYSDDRKKFKRELKAALKLESETFIKARVNTPDGSIRWIEFSARGATSRSSYEGLIRDVTKEMLTEFELRELKTRNELITDSAGLLIYDCDIASGLISWSGNILQLVGYTPEEMGTVDQWEQLIHPEDRGEASRLLHIARENLTPYDVIYRFRTKRQGYLFIHDRGLFVADQSREAVRMLGVMSDISQRIQTHAIIEQSEKSYRELFDTVGEAILIQKPDGTIVDVNAGVCEMFGYTKEELMGKTHRFFSASNKNDFEKAEEMIRNAYNGKPQSFRWWVKTKSGEEVVVEVNLTKGTYFGESIIIGAAFDITDKIAAEETLKESERRFRRLIDELTVGVIIQGPKGEIQMANTSALSMLKVSERALSEKSMLDGSWNFIAEDGKAFDTLKYPWRLAASTKEAVHGVVIGIQEEENKSNLWALVNAEPTLLENGKILNIVITLTDITERRKIEEDLKESELRFRTLQEASWGGIGLHEKGRIIDCNQGLSDITGFTYEELVGSNGLNLIAPEFRDLVYQNIVNKTELPYDVEGIRKDGSRYYLEIHAKNIPYKEASIRVTEFRDITERKAVESKIREQNEKLVSITQDLQLRNEQLQEFAQIVSHNLRSPVGNILSLLNFIENAQTSEERGEYLNLLKEAGTTTLSTLQELNEVLQIKQNKNIEKHRLEFANVFANVKRMLVARIVEVDAEIITDFSAAPEIDYPNIYLESILLNLLSNALKYTVPDRKPVIQLKTTRVDDMISLSVKDNGSGLNMQRYGHHIFKLRKTFHKHPESRGIGLFMIKNQIEAMGGDISVTSVQNEGSTFVVNFNSRSQEK